MVLSYELYLIAVLGLLIPSLAAAVRRLHDRGHRRPAAQQYVCVCAQRVFGISHRQESSVAEGLGCEAGGGKEGEIALINAYRNADNFTVGS